MAYRIAKALETLRAQVNAKWPTRSKASDGWIGDAKHAASKSDHNPNSAGVVQALDITHDPKNGCDAHALAELFRLNRDPRIKYVISNGRIFSSTTSPWVWRPYSGANKHDKHVHFSVRDEAKFYDDTTAWNLGTPNGEPAPTPPPEPEAIWLQEFASKVILWEGRRDANGRLTVHKPGDGSFEVAGISSNSHPETARGILDRINAGKHDEADMMVRNFIVRFTDPVKEWVTDPGCEFFLRDCYYNRGGQGAALILQAALGFSAKQLDADIGPLTLAAVRETDPRTLLDRLRRAREEYEIAKYGRREQYWKGLTNRWNNALAAAKALQAVGASPAPVPAPPTPTYSPTPEPQPVSPVPSPATPAVVPSVPRVVVRDLTWVQSSLNALGANPPLMTDGVYGLKTKAMLELFQAEKGLPITGYADAETINEIQRSLDKPIPPPPPPQVLPSFEPERESFWAKLSKLWR